MRIGWLMGWAIPETWFGAMAREAFPGAEHLFVAPAADALQVIESQSPFDWVVGYSLGSLLMLREAPRVERLGRVALLAPLFAFPREEGLGGRIARAEVRALARRLNQDRAQALGGFYRRAGLAGGAGLEERTTGVVPSGGLAQSGARGEESGARLATEMIPAGSLGELEDGVLAWGLDQLQTVRCPPALPGGWIGWCGMADALLDAERLHALDARITPVPGATHHPRALMQAFAAHLQ